MGSRFSPKLSFLMFNYTSIYAIGDTKYEKHFTSPPSDRKACTRTLDVPLSSQSVTSNRPTAGSRTGRAGCLSSAGPVRMKPACASATAPQTLVFLSAPDKQIGILAIKSREVFIQLGTEKPRLNSF